MLKCWRGELRQMVQQLEETETVDCYIGGVVVANTPYEGLMVDEARNRILEAYKGSVFKDKHDGDPPCEVLLGKRLLKYDKESPQENNVHFN